MELSDFRNSLINNAIVKASQENGFTEQSFAGIVGDYLVKYEELSSYNPCHARMNGPRNLNLKLDGYEWDEDDDSFRFVIVLFSGDPEIPVLNKVLAQKQFKSAINFVESSISGFIQQNAEPASDHYHLARDIKLQYEQKKISRFRFYLITDYKLSERVRDWPEGQINTIPTDFRIWDIDRLFNVENSSLGYDPILVVFDSNPANEVQILKSKSTADKYEGYLAMVSGNLLANIYDEYGSRLLEGNVRAFLSSRGKVNSGIRKTIKENPGMFFAYNNGIAATASEIKIIKNEAGELILQSATNFQIVNGGQTTASLATSRWKDKSDLTKIMVPMKISVVDEALASEITPNISRYANSQNKVSDSDLWSNHPFHLRIEKLSRQTLAPSRGTSQIGTYWFYERSRGQYLSELNRNHNTAAQRTFTTQYPNTQIITKEVLAKVENSWLGYPFTVCMGAQKNFMRFIKGVDDKWDKNESFNKFYFKQIVCRILLHDEAEIISVQHSYKSIKAHAANYAIACLSKLLTDEKKDLDWNSIWKAQAVSEACKEQLNTIINTIVPIMLNTGNDAVIITEWFKRELLWNKIIEKIHNMKLIDSLETKSQRDAQQDVNEAIEEQKASNSIDETMRAMAIGRDGWQKLIQWSKTNQIYSYSDISILENFSSFSSNRTPSAKQARYLISLLNKALEAGYDS